VVGIRAWSLRKGKKTFSFSLIERVILSAGAMLIFSVSFQIDQMPEGKIIYALLTIYRLKYSAISPPFNLSICQPGVITAFVL